MKNTTSLLSGGFVALLFLLCPDSVESRGNQEVIRLAHSLEDSIDHLEDEFRAHYRGIPEYGSLIGAVRSLRSKAAHIHDLAHDTTNGARHLKNDVTSMENYVHRIQRYLDQIARYRNIRVGSHHVNEELVRITRNLHRLEDIADSWIRREESRRNSGPAVIIPNPFAHNSAHLHPRYGSGDRNLGNLFIPYQEGNSQYSRHGHEHDHSGHRHDHRDRGVSTSNQFHRDDRRDSGRSSSRGKPSSHSGNRNSSRDRDSHFSGSRSNRSDRTPPMPPDPRKVLESLFRGFNPR